jgi:diguanylate cyclase (GGDEF)-like protein
LAYSLEVIRRSLFAWFLLASSASATESGYPPLTFFRQEQHKGGSQTFDVKRDASGRLFFANLDGVLIYDGAWWKRIDVPGSSAFSVVPDRAGRIGVTTVDEFGYLRTDASGSLFYESLTPRIPAALRHELGQAGLCVSGGGLLFVTPQFAARWNGQALTLLERNPSGVRGRRCREVDGRTYLAGYDGLQELGGRKTFLGKRVDAALPGFVLLRNQGLFRYDETPVETDASLWLRGKGVMDVRVLQDGRIAIATLRNGLLVMTADGRIEQIIDAAAGLPDVFLFAVEQDAEGALWLGMDTAIVRIDFASAVSVLDERIGLIGMAQTVGRHAGKLYVGSPHGIYGIDPAGAATGTTARARRLPGLDHANPWSLLSSHGELLAGTYGGLYRIRDGAEPKLVEGTADETIYAMTPSRRDPSLVWLGMESGLATIQRVGNDWHYRGLLPVGKPHVRRIIESADGTIWCGTEAHGVVRISADRSAVTQYASGHATMIEIDGRVILVASGTFQQAMPNGALAADPLLGHIRTDEPALAADTDARGNVWISTRPPKLVRRRTDGTYEREAHAVGAMAGDGHTYFADADGAMWIGTERGLYRVAQATLTTPQRQPTPAIRRVVDGRDRTLFDSGASGLTPPDASLPHSFRRVRIEVAPLSYRGMTEYQYRLDPSDATWSSWTDQAFLDYTNLGAEDYTFRVRTRGMAGAISDEARWSFTVRAPWYATRWAAALWIVLCALLIGGIILLRTRALHRRARHLQSLVDEQTVMLRQANEQLERLSLADPLTGVANRRAFDRALSEAWKRAVRHDQPLAIIMLDLDHFKLLNDAQGHAAGDDCLVLVAQQMENAIRGNGDDLVARWGGEEFVVLLGNADDTSAMAVAHRIRAAIETLGVTASLGVAVRMHDATEAALIERADRALYAAKSAGRNRVQLDVQRMSA